MHQQAYHSSEIQAWEGRWSAQQNSAYGWCNKSHGQQLNRCCPGLNRTRSKALRCVCGQGNNSGDGYLIASYLAAQGYDVEIYAAALGESTSLQQAHAAVVQQGIMIHTGFTFQHSYDAYIDALFGIGLNRELSSDWQAVIQKINSQTGLKLRLIFRVVYRPTQASFYLVRYRRLYLYGSGLKAGLFTGQGKAYAESLSLFRFTSCRQCFKTFSFTCSTACAACTASNLWT